MTDLAAPLQTRDDLSRLAFVLDGLASALSVGWEIEEGSLDELLAQLKAPDPAGDARELAHLARVASYELQRYVVLKSARPVPPKAMLDARWVKQVEECLSAGTVLGIDHGLLRSISDQHCALGSESLSALTSPNGS
jgi:hypothetical protein